jgi:hypothetical protein
VRLCKKGAACVRASERVSWGTAVDIKNKAPRAYYRLIHLHNNRALERDAGREKERDADGEAGAGSADTN